jgi:hypothetical protein
MSLDRLPPEGAWLRPLRPLSDLVSARSAIDD